MLKVRVIPTLLSDGFSVVKGRSFNSWRTVGALTPAIRVFNRRDVDELMILDVAARREGRSPEPWFVEETAAEVRVPLTFGGNVSTLADIETLLASGADKVVLNTAAIVNPALVETAARRFGSQCVVVAIDILRADGALTCASHSGSVPTGLEAIDWARQCADSGAGELVVTSVARDGTMTGYDLEVLASVSAAVNCPVIAAGGAGGYHHFVEAIQVAGASAVAAGAMFQFTESTPALAREYLASHGVPVRACSEEVFRDDDSGSGHRRWPR